MKSIQWTSLLLCCMAGILTCGHIVSSAEPETLDTQQITKLHATIKRQAGESRWMEIAWYPSVWEARQKAAVEGKPIFLMAGSGGAPAAGC